MSPAVRLLFSFLLLCSIGLRSAAQSSEEDALQESFSQGQKALAAGHYEEAQRDYESLRQRYPQIAEVHATLGVIYFQQRKFDEALPELRRALKLKPELPKLDSLIAMSLSELGHYEEAVPGLEKAFRRPSSSADPEVRRMAGLQLQRAYQGLRRDREAVQVALELNHLFPKDPEVLYQTSRVYGNYAYLTIQELNAVAPDSIWRHQADGEAYESQGSFESAVSEFREVLKIDPARRGIHYRIGRTLLSRYEQSRSQPDADQARREFEQELKIDPSNANAAYEVAEIYRRSNQFDLAAQFFELALKYYPEFEDAHVGLATVLTAQQKPEPAIAHLKQAVALKARDEVAWYRLSLAERMIGNTKEQKAAMAEFQRLKAAPAADPSAGTAEITKQSVDQ